MKPKTILLVEDNADDVFFMRQALQLAGITHHCEVCHDGQEAIDYLAGTGKFSDRSRYPIPTLILLDLKLPRKTGHEVLKWMRQQTPLSALRVVVLTSSEDKIDIARAYQSGASSYVVKPTTRSARLKMAEMLRLYWLEANIAPGFSEPEEQPARIA